MRLFTLAFVAGALVLQAEAELPRFAFGSLGLAFALAMALIPARHRVARAIVVAAAGAFIGYGYAAWRAQARLEDELPRALEGEDIVITGVVVGLPQVTERGVRFAFAVEDRAPSLVSLSWYDPAPKITAGERWRVTARLKRARGYANPHAFDFEPWALERGIRATGYVRAKSPATRLAERSDGWPQTLNRWRGNVREAMVEHLGDSRLRGVLVALAIGDQDSISADDWEVFWRTGVGHLMSISGLHITMFAALFFTIAYGAWVRTPALALRIPARKGAVVVGVIAAFAYTLMTGYAVPAQRTFTMLSIVALCVLADRHGSASRVLALAALAVLALDPWAVLSPGFWLSFGAVAAIFYVMALRTGSKGRLHGAALEQLAVTLAMLPMLMALFQQVSLVSPIANAFAIPIVSLVVVPLTIAGAFVAAPLLDVAHAVMLGVMAPLEWLADLPQAMVESHAPAAWAVAAAVVGCAWLLAPRGFPLRALGAAWLVPMFAVRPPGPAPGEAWIDVLDVGNGLAVVVRTATHALAYDAGPTWSSESDSGNRIVAPFLRGEGVGRLDGLIVSHADDDHAGGAASLALSREPEWMLSPLAADHVLHKLVDRSIRCESGMRWRWDRVDFTVLHPARESYEGPRKENDRGCVVKVSAGGGSMLLAADVEARSEAEMIARAREALRSDVVLVPHHGSKTSSTPAFIDAVSPRIGILSVGYRNRFHHPNAAVVTRYAGRGVELRRTEREGALHVVLSRGGATVSGQQDACRYWSERPCAAER